jgi:hypothetical protein
MNLPYDGNNLPDEAMMQSAYEPVARHLRDDLLKESDWIVPVTDHPAHAEYLAWRTALRSWPSTSDFPYDMPVLGE